MKALRVIDRPKHDKAGNIKAERLADHPAMKELLRMADAGEIDRARTVDHLTKQKRRTSRVPCPKPKV